MIITDFNKWVGYQFGNKLLGLNNLIQLSHFYNQDYNFVPFNGLELFDIKTKTKDYNNEPYEIIDVNSLIKNKDNIILDNNKIYYLEPCLIELFHEFNKISTFDIFKFKEEFNNEKKMVGIHYRGTDFKVWDDKCILPYEYYKNSIDFILNDIKEEFTFVLLTDDSSLESFNKTIEYLDRLNVDYCFGKITDYLYDFKVLAYCDYIISSPSTFCITASFCGKKNKKIIHSHDFIMNYKNNSDYFRDVFWKKTLDFNSSNDYILNKLI
jgi:hypothetical protein